MKPIAKVWTFASSSGSGTYETLQYTDGTTSCACPGWTRRVATDGSRSCKHTRLIDQGLADQHSESNHSYSQPHQNNGTSNRNHSPHTCLFGTLGKRKLA